MKKNDAYKKNKQAKCDVCKQPVSLDQYGNGNACPNCGWRQTEDSANNPDMAGIMNISSLNNARELYKQGRRLVASFDDFIAAYKHYGELEFTYNNIVYGVFAPKGIIILFERQSGKEIGHFQNIEEFRRKANINGLLLEDIWYKVENTDFLQ